MSSGDEIVSHLMQLMENTPSPLMFPCLNRIKSAPFFISFFFHHHVSQQFLHLVGHTIRRASYDFCLLSMESRSYQYRIIPMNVHIFFYETEGVCTPTEIY
jgi:hypothetical protein